MKVIIQALLLATICCGGFAWDQDELEIFDLVEEINKSFYEFMNITQDATSNEVKRAFRNLSIVLHPDKNSADDANIQFRNLVSIYEVLKEPSKREKYNKVLRDGLPNWKSALYYYRRMRKIGLYEGSLILFIIISFGQYLFAWAAYLEKKYTAEQIIGSKLKKLQRKNKNIDMDDILNEIPLPSIFNTLPFQIPFVIWNLPTMIKGIFSKASELKEIAMEKRRVEIEEVKRQKELEQELEELARQRKEKKENLRKRRQNITAPEKTDEELRGYAQIHGREYSEKDMIKTVSQKTPVCGGFWTDEDLSELIRLVKKYPGGSSSRWSVIAETMNRTVQEVTFMAAKMKENGYRLPSQNTGQDEESLQLQELSKKDKVKKTSSTEKTILVPQATWSQEQQRALESAIIKYRKNTSCDRWEKIANCVPNKTKEECLTRYKHLCELVKLQKANEGTFQQIEDEIGTDTSPNRHDGKTRAESSFLCPLSEKETNVECEMECSKRNNKRSKRNERRRRRDLSDEEDSDDIYQYEIN